MIVDYFKLSEEPFGVTPDPRFLYLSKQHREAMASLAYGTESGRGFFALIAQPGMGKTSLLYHYLESQRGKARTAFLFRTDCDTREFMRHLLLDLNIDSCGRDLPWMHDALNRVLLEEMNAGRKFILVIDEAQNLEEEVLESIRLLSNFETPWVKLIQIVMAGQPQLAEILNRPSAAQVRQRISLVLKIDPLSPADVDQYIDHRLRTAGCKDVSIFTTGARLLIAESSGGIPRNINNLCFNAMSLACALKRQSIDREIVLEVLADLDLESLVKKPVAGGTMIPNGPSASFLVAEQAKESKRPIFQGVFTKLTVTAALVLAVVTGVDKGGMRPANPVGITSEGTSQLPALEVPQAAGFPEFSTGIPPLSTGLTLAQSLAYNHATNPSGDGQHVQQNLHTTLRPKRPEHVDPDQQIVVPSAPLALSSVAKSALQNIDSFRTEAGKE